MKTPKQKPPPIRANHNTTLTVSLPKWLKDQINEAASEENRTASNYVATELAKLIALSRSRAWVEQVAEIKGEASPLEQSN